MTTIAYFRMGDRGQYVTWHNDEPGPHAMASAVSVWIVPGTWVDG